MAIYFTYTARCLSGVDFSFFLPTHPLMLPLQAKSQVATTDEARYPQSSLSPLNLALGESNTQVVDQVLDAVDKVEGKGESKSELDGALDDEGQGSEAGSQRGALDVEAQERGGEICGEVDVGGAGEHAAGDTGPGGGAEPGLLHLVDAQVGGDGAVQALVDEDLLAFLL